ncbi:helix-turn-helix domain-containing protein [Brevibacillus fluminis]|uniref:helix-turn-helix domain-containing protein n=1 Tax=Brevibacillus fluminis TaxID=511487 RepID=UPI003F8A9E13
MTLGEKMKKLREQHGWTQAQAAEKLGVSSQVVSNYERDYRSPDKETLSKIAKMYHCSIDWLLGLSDSQEQAGEGGSTVQTEKVNRAFLEFPEGISEEEREYLEKQMKLQLEIFRSLKGKDGK